MSEYEQKLRAELVKGLRDMATFLEANPEIKAPYSVSEYIYIDHTDYRRKPDPEGGWPDDASFEDKYETIENPELEKSDMAHIARVAGHTEKDYSTNAFKLIKRFSDSVSLVWQTSRASVCKKKVVGTTLQERVEYERKVVGTEEVEIVEWECSPLLS